MALEIDALGRVLTADPARALAAAFEVLSFAGYVALLAHVTGLDARTSYRTTVQALPPRGCCRAPARAGRCRRCECSSVTAAAAHAR